MSEAQAQALGAGDAERDDADAVVEHSTIEVTPRQFSDFERGARSLLIRLHLDQHRLGAGAFSGGARFDLEVADADRATFNGNTGHVSGSCAFIGLMSALDPDSRPAYIMLFKTS
jgi:hypothetical protein